MTVLIFVFFIVSASNAVPRDITDFFPIAKGNLTKITWAHAVNSQKLLEAALQSNVMMLEGDIVLGRLSKNGSSQDIIPIMAHPPATTSDLSLLEFIQRVQSFNIKIKETSLRKGVKLDFKSIEAFEGSLSILRRKYPQINFPLWINADILRGPLDATAKPVDPGRFLPPCKMFENATLSIGWTTQYVKNIKIKYTLEQVEDLFDVIKNHGVEQPITVPIRAAFATESFLELKELLFVLPPGTTLTLWHGKDDYINLDSLNMVINSLGVGRVFIDLPQDIQKNLNLGA